MMFATDTQSYWQSGSPLAYSCRQGINVHLDDFLVLLEAFKKALRSKKIIVMVFSSSFG
jgi:hypothetical protein